MKRILVSGGVGFIGSHLCTWLIDEGHDVICLDNFFTGLKDNTVHSVDDHHFEMVGHDIAYLCSAEVDEIYDSTCSVSSIHYQHGPIQTAKTSVIGAINMLGLTMRLDAKILQASTSEVYENPIVHPQPKSYWGSVNPVGYRPCYDEGKRCAETLFMDYHRRNNVRVKIIRIFGTYGPRMLPNDGWVVSNFILQALNNEDITIYGDGKQTRSPQYINDLTEGMVRVMNTEGEFTGPINLGSPNEFPVLESTERIISMAGSPSKIVFESLPDDDPKQRQPDITLAKEKSGWQPTAEPEEGLKRMIEYFKNA